MKQGAHPNDYDDDVLALLNKAMSLGLAGGKNRGRCQPMLEQARRQSDLQAQLSSLKLAKANKARAAQAEDEAALGSGDLDEVSKQADAIKLQGEDLRAQQASIELAKAERDQANAKSARVEETVAAREVALEGTTIPRTCIVCESVADADATEDADGKPLKEAGNWGGCEPCRKHHGRDSLAWPRYCSQACQRSHWKISGHRERCES